jgi:signal transduction histidine kinase
MNILKYIQSHLNIKLFLSFVILIVVFTIVLIGAVEFIMPSAFEGHLEFMNSLVTGEGDVISEHNRNLFESFRSAFYESLQFALHVSLICAIVISVFFSREFVRPIRELSRVSRKISEGNYSQRIPLSKELSISEMDELKQLAINFNQMASKLENTENLRRQLIGDVSHELRTPISLIKASMEGLIDGIVPMNNKTFYQVQVEADRLSKLVNDLQELSIIESGAYKINKEKSDINEVISSVISNLAPQFLNKHIQVSSNTKNSKITVNFDIDRMKQVLTNILANAYQYSEESGKVNITSSTKNDHVEISISDTGRGISVENLPHIFTRFYRVDKSRSKNCGGSGIGLTITKQLVEAHGGKIWAKSQGENKGTTITFTLPYS